MACTPVPALSGERRRHRAVRLVAVAAVGAGLLATAVVAVPGATAEPKPTLAEVEARIEVLDNQVAEAAERMNGANARLADLERSLATLRTKATTQRAAYQRVASGLGQLASAVYRGGGIDADLALLMADDPSSFLAQAAALEQVAADQNTVLRRTATARLALASTEAVVSQQQAAADAARAEAAAQKSEIDARLNDAQQLLGQLKAEERARLEAAAKARRAAERAAAKAAAAAAAQAAARDAADRASRDQRPSDPITTRPAPVPAAPAAPAEPVSPPTATPPTATPTPAPKPVAPKPAPKPVAPKPAPKPVAPKPAPKPAPVTAPDTPAVSDRASIAVQAGLTKVGNDYVAGGRGPSVFDCSGFTSWAWRQAGVSLVAYSYTQYATTRRVSRSQARPGDLVFFFGSGAHHVGLYLGGGQMVHAANPSRGVIISDIDGPWYGERFSGFGRVVG